MFTSSNINVYGKISSIHICTCTIINASKEPRKIFVIMSFTSKIPGSAAYNLGKDL